VTQEPRILSSVNLFSSRLLKSERERERERERAREREKEKEGGGEGGGGEGKGKGGEVRRRMRSRRRRMFYNQAWKRDTSIPLIIFWPEHNYMARETKDEANL
jgi:hypothetical protein